MRDRFHPEKRPGEVFVCNVESRGSMSWTHHRMFVFDYKTGEPLPTGIDAIGLKTRRAGVVATNIFGETLGDFEPVFAQRSEVDAWLSAVGTSGGTVKPSPEEVLAEFNNDTIAEAARRLFEDEEFKPAVAHLFCNTYKRSIDRLMAKGDYVQLAKAAMMSCDDQAILDFDDRVMDAWLKAAEEIAARPRMGR